MNMNKQDITLLLVHGALAGLSAQGNVRSSGDIANQSVDIALLAIQRMEELGYKWPDPDTGPAKIESSNS